MRPDRLDLALDLVSPTSGPLLIEPQSQILETAAGMAALWLSHAQSALETDSVLVRSRRRRDLHCRPGPRRAFSG
jgi:hypothetical protein